MKIVEMLGLPAAGKSYVLENKGARLAELKSQGAYNIHLVETGFSFRKLRNIVAGVACLFFSQPISLILSFLVRANSKKILLLCERIGRTKAMKGALIDEGVTQACWAVLLKGKGKHRLELVLDIIRRLSKMENCIIYVSANKALIYERAKQRLNSYPKTAYNYQSNEHYVQARKSMAYLLKELRRSGVSFKHIRN